MYINYCVLNVRKHMPSYGFVLLKVLVLRRLISGVDCNKMLGLISLFRWEIPGIGGGGAFSIFWDGWVLRATTLWSFLVELPQPKPVNQSD